MYSKSLETALLLPLAGKNNCKFARFMERTKLIKLTTFIGVLVTISVVLGAFTFPQSNVQKLSMQLTARTLFQGKSITGKGAVYYKTQNGLMVTKMDSPLDQVVITTSTGEYKSYDRQLNTITQTQGTEFSSKNSFIYSFLSGKTNDMGLSAMGYKLTDVRNENGVVVNTWMAPIDKQLEAQKIEVAYENYLPIFLGFSNGSGKVFQKTYYSNYQAISYLQMPMTITEISFFNDSDSSITQRSYSDLKVNAQVDNTWLDFQVPKDAKVIDQASYNSPIK